MSRWFSDTLTSLSSTLHDTLKPLWRSNVDVLKDAWQRVEKSLQKILIEQLDAPLSDSELVVDLNSLVDALVAEEREVAGESTGPCFEYFLNEKILDRLCAIGMPDRPQGMRQLITKTVDAILLNTRHPILPSMSVHMAVRQFIEVCYSKEDHKRKSGRAAFVQLLHTIAGKIRGDPSIAYIFFDDAPMSGHSSTPALRDEQQQANQAEAHDTLSSSQLAAAAHARAQPECLLFTALSSMLSESVDGAHAYEACCWLLQVPSRSITEFILQSDFIDTIMQSLTHLFRCLPPPHECAPFSQLLSQHNSYALAVVKRLTYIDTLAKSTYPIVGSTLSMAFTHFLIEQIAPLLLDARESVCCWATGFVATLLRTLMSDAIRGALYSFLIGEEKGPEQIEAKHLMRSTLLKRMDSVSEPLCVATLDLMISLFRSRDPVCLLNLLVRNLLPCAHITQLPASVHVQNIQTHQQIQTDNQANNNHISSVTSPTDQTQSDDRVPLLTASIYPVQSSVLFADFYDLTITTQDDYLLDAQQEGSIWMARWESESISPFVLAASSVGFYDGLFLSTLLNRVESMFESSLAANLRVTALLAALCHCPHPALHAYMYEPNLHLAPHVRLPIQVLAQVWNKGIKKQNKMQNWKKRKEDVKARLNAAIQPDAHSDISTSSTSIETMDSERFFQGMIVLEEFLKEMYAIGAVKAGLFASAKLLRLHKGKANLPNHAIVEQSSCSTPAHPCVDSVACDVDVDSHVVSLRVDVAVSESASGGSSVANTPHAANQNNNQHLNSPLTPLTLLHTPHATPHSDTNTSLERAADQDLP